MFRDISQAPLFAIFTELYSNCQIQSNISIDCCYIDFRYIVVVDKMHHVGYTTNNTKRSQRNSIDKTKVESLMNGTFLLCFLMLSISLFLVFHIFSMFSITENAELFD